LAYARDAGMVGLVFSALLVAKPTMADASDRCGMYPDVIYESAYAAYSDCRLKKVGEQPLWHGITSTGFRQKIRFAFTEGHFAYTRVINFTELANQTGIIKVYTIIATKEHKSKVIGRQRHEVSRRDIALLNTLGDQSGVWHFANGSWDDEEIYQHCQSLDMERINGEGYRFSSVQIGCNHPSKLMPFVDHLTKLAEIAPKYGGRLY